MFTVNTDGAIDVTPNETVVRVVQLGKDLNLPCTRPNDEGIRAITGRVFIIVYIT